MRAAGCVINDAWDRNLDGRIERTRNRPLASRQISLVEAGVFTCMLGLVGMAVLLALPEEAIVTGLVSLPLIVIYPLAKRIIGLPQIILGLTFGWGALLGWAAHGIWPAADALILYAATVAWIFGYDTIYAVQDMEDDRKVGIKSSALTLGAALTCGQRLLCCHGGSAGDPRGKTWSWLGLLCRVCAALICAARSAASTSLPPIQQGRFSDQIAIPAC